MANEDKTLQTNEGRMVLRRLAPILNAALTGRAYGGQAWSTGAFSDLRSMEEACGYPDTITLRDYYNAFCRSGTAARIVEAYPDATWRRPPSIFDDDTPNETAFEKALADMERNLRLWSVCKRADVVAGLGRYGILIIGADDGKELHDELTTCKSVLYLQPYREERAKVVEVDSDATSARFGKPVLYEVWTGDDDKKGDMVKVHHSRVIHIPDNCTESDIYGMPRLQRVWNNLLDLLKVAGGSAEMFWRGAFPGIAFEMDADAEVDTDSKDAMDEEIQKYIHGLERYIKLQGTTAKSIAPQVADPSKHLDVQFTLLSIASRIPKRILMGSERGELASGQDDENWNGAVATRQENWAEPVIVRPLIDRLVEVGVLPAPSQGQYECGWQDLNTVTEKDKAEVAKIVTEALKAYADSGASSIMPLRTYLLDVLGWENAAVDRLEQALEEARADEEAQAEHDAQIAADAIAEEQQRIAAEQGAEAGTGDENTGTATE